MGLKKPKDKIRDYRAGTYEAKHTIRIPVEGELYHKREKVIRIFYNVVIQAGFYTRFYMMSEAAACWRQHRPSPAIVVGARVRI